MTEQVFKNAFFSLNAVDLSGYVKSVTLSAEADAPEITAMGDDWRNFLPDGLKQFSIALTFNQDYDAAKVDATLYAAFAASQAIVFRPDAGVKSATNPEFTGSVINTAYQAAGGAVGDAHETPTTLQGNGALTRDAS